MAELMMKDSLNELRDDSKNSNNEVVFRKRLFGGYYGKEVSEYIKTLQESLKNAEVSFNERLEEYAAMTAMLEQERDNYINRVKESEATNLEIQEQINTLSKENEELTNKLQDSKDETVSPDDLAAYEATVLENEAMKKEINAYKEESKEDSEDRIELKEQFDQLKLMVQDLYDQIEDYDGNEVSKKAYDSIQAENEILKKKYEDAVYENSIALAEKEGLIEQNKKMSDNLIDVSEKNKELRNTVTASEQKTRKMIAEFEARADECAQNHRNNFDEITENIKSTLNILHNENVNIANLIKSPFGEFDPETEDVKDELESTPFGESDPETENVKDELESASLSVDGLKAIAALTASMEKKLLSKKKY